MLVQQQYEYSYSCVESVCETLKNSREGKTPVLLSYLIKDNQHDDDNKKDGTFRRAFISAASTHAEAKSPRLAHNACSTNPTTPTCTAASAH